LPGESRGLIISGPNAGGKTVTITAVGPSALMARAGLPIPTAPGSDIPLYRTVYTAIGDEGDLSRDLSTFTAHLTALKHILEIAGRVGLPLEVCARARELLGGGSSALSTAVERLDAERAALAAARAEAEELRAELERERASAAAEREGLAQAEREVRAGARAELVADIARRKQDVARLVAELQAAPAMARAVEVDRALASAEAEEQRSEAREDAHP